MPAAPAPAAAAAPPLVLVWGDDDHAVTRRARELWTQWQAAAPGGDHEVIDAAATASADALKALARLHEALQTLPFFGGTKIIWFRGCNFLAEDRTSEARAVAEGVAALAQTLKDFRWDGVRLLISAGKVDRRKAFYKTLEKLAQVEAHAGLSADDRDWAEKAEALAAREFQAAGRRVTAEALAALVAQVGPNSRLLAGECEKLAVYAGDRPEITAADVEAVGVRAKHARAFALADAVGDRDLPRVLRRLDEELWAMKTDRKRSGLGLLYGLITKVRCLLLARELLREGLLRAGGEFAGFKAQLERLPAGRFAEDDRYNPRRITSYVLFRATQQAGRWTTAELVRGMELLLECNRRLVGSQLDDALLLQQLVVELVGAPAGRVASRPAGV